MCSIVVAFYFFLQNVHIRLSFLTFFPNLGQKHLTASQKFLNHILYRMFKDDFPIFPVQWVRNLCLRAWCKHVVRIWAERGSPQEREHIVFNLLHPATCDTVSKHQLQWCFWSSLALSPPPWPLLSSLREFPALTTGYLCESKKGFPIPVSQR